MKHAKWIALAALLGLLLQFNSRSQDAIDIDSLMEIDDLLVDEDGISSGGIADPFGGLNRSTFRFNNFVFKKIGYPFTRQYVRIVPKEARKGIGNFFNNLEYVIRLTGNILQFKFGRATQETGKFLVNSTVGIGGLIEISKNDSFLDVPEEDIGQVFGSWGVKHGFYVVIPFRGPSSLRDFVGRYGGNAVHPVSEPWSQVDDSKNRLIL